MSPEESPREEPAASKRRRSHEDNETDEGPPGKRIASAANDVAEALGAQLRLREERRAELRAVYANYGTLLTGTDTGSEALAFQGLLDCAQGAACFGKLDRKVAGPPAPAKLKRSCKPVVSIPTTAAMRPVAAKVGPAAAGLLGKSHPAPPYDPPNSPPQAAAGRAAWPPAWSPASCRASPAMWSPRPGCSCPCTARGRGPPAPPPPRLLTATPPPTACPSAPRPAPTRPPHHRPRTRTRARPPSPQAGSVGQVRAGRCRVAEALMPTTPPWWRPCGGTPCWGWETCWRPPCATPTATFRWSWSWSTSCSGGGGGKEGGRRGRSRGRADTGRVGTFLFTLYAARISRW